MTRGRKRPRFSYSLRPDRSSPFSQRAQSHNHNSAILSLSVGERESIHNRLPGKKVAMNADKKPSTLHHQFLGTAIDIALKAGKLLHDRLDDHHQIDYKARFNLVTEADYASEELILSEIGRRFPSHSVLSEESGEKKGQEEYLWVVDPLDGTTNFAHGFPLFAVSIALVIGGQTAVGVVYDPNQDELFTATKGGGAFLNRSPIEISKTPELAKALLATGFPYTIRETPGNFFRYFEALYVNCQGVRRCGAAALDLAYLAAGRLDGFWEAGLNPWDTAAGSLLVSESGGVLTTFTGKPFDPYFAEVLAANPNIHGQMLGVIDKVSSEG